MCPWFKIGRHQLVSFLYYKKKSKSILSNVHTLLEDTIVCVCDVNVCLPRRQKRMQNIGKRLLPLIPASNFPAAVLYTIQSHWDSMGRPGLRHSQHPPSEREINRGFALQDIDKDCRLGCIWFNRIKRCCNNYVTKHIFVYSETEHIPERCCFWMILPARQVIIMDTEQRRRH